MLSEPPGADPYARWCGRRRGEPGAYPILRAPGVRFPPATHLFARETIGRHDEVQADRGGEGTASRLPAVRGAQVSRSGFNAWLRRQPSRRWVWDVRLLELIHQVHEESDETYGSPRIHAELRHRGVRVGRKRVD